ncbi:glycosyltransferase [Candidatus Fermentibacteria bacterium]|nr:glycosyltransferase [Candidatus Fermentibacteria bacterium]
MRILLVSYQSVLAGSTFSTAYLAAGLATRGHRVWLACRRGSMYQKLLRDSGVELVELPLKGRLDLRSAIRIAGLVRQEGIGIVNSQASIDRYLTIWARRLLGMPARLVHTRRQSPKPSLARLQGAFYHWGTDRLVAVSRGLKDELVRRMGIPPGHIEVIHNGTPEEKYEAVREADPSALRRRLGLTGEEFVIGCVSRHKMQEQLLLSLREIDTFQTKVLLVGIREEELRLNRSEWPSGHDVICTGGRVPPDEALLYYRLFDVHVLPSVTEGLSQSLLEAMSLGVPVIATDAGGNPDLVENGRTGYLFPPNDLSVLADRITLLHDQPSKGRELAEAARAMVLEEFTMERVLDRYEEFFQALST